MSNKEIYSELKICIYYCRNLIFETSTSYNDKKLCKTVVLKYESKMFILQLSFKLLKGTGDYFLFIMVAQWSVDIL